MIKRISTGRRKCLSKIDQDTSRSYCFGDIKTRLEVRERHFAESSVLFQRSCLCNGTNYTEVPLIFTSSGRELELHLIALNMSSYEDPDTLFFEATYEFVKAPYVCKESRKHIGTSGEASLSIEDVSFVFGLSQWAKS